MDAITLRCTTPTGNVLATLTLDTTSGFARTALSAATSGLKSGADAERFARHTFAALANYEQNTDVRARLILKHLRAMDRLALTAVGRGIRAVVTWS